MTIQDSLKRWAFCVAEEMQANSHDLEAQAKKFEAKLYEIKLELNAAKTLMKRLDAFPVRDGADFLCPNCWLTDGRREALSFPPGDIMRCDSCGCVEYVT